MRFGPVAATAFWAEQLHQAVGRLRDGIGLCSARGDHGSRDLLEKMLTGEEEHADWLETQLSVIGEIGEAHYLAQQLHE